MPSHTVTQRVNTLSPLPGVYVTWWIGHAISHSDTESTWGLRGDTLSPLPGVYVRGDMPSHTVTQRGKHPVPSTWGLCQGRHAISHSDTEGKHPVPSTWCSMSGETCHLTQ